MTIKEFFKKYFTKQVLTVVLVVLVGVTTYATLNMRSKLLLTRSELLSARALYGIVEKEKSRLDSLVRIYVQSIEQRDAVIVSKDKQIAKQSLEIKVLKDSLKNVLVDIGNVTADSSYKYINDRIPPVAELKYPFDSTQVKNIHYTFIERDGLFNINIKLDGLVANLSQTSQLKDNQINELKSLNTVYISQREIYRRENEAYKIEIAGLDKALKQQKLFKNMAIGGVGVAFILPPIIKILSK